VWLLVFKLLFPSILCLICNRSDGDQNRIYRRGILDM
jgi:hypothetical protein